MTTLSRRAFNRTLVGGAATLGAATRVRAQRVAPPRT